MLSRPTALPWAFLAITSALGLIMLGRPAIVRAQQHPRTGPPIDQPPALHVPPVNAMAVAPDQLTNRCPDTIAPAPANAPSWTGWSPSPDNWRFQPEKDAGIPASRVANLKLKWAFGIPNVNIVRSQPAIYRGRVYVGANDGTVYSLDAKTGCTFWATKASKAVRSGLAVGKAGEAEAIFFGDSGGDLYALDAESGKFLWSAHPEDHPSATITGTPTYSNGRLYVPMSSGEEQARRRPGYECCTFRGSVTALDAATGKIIWKTYMAPATPSPQGKAPNGTAILGPSGMAIWSSPTLDLTKHRLYVGTGDNYAPPPTPTADAVVALDLNSGKILWQTQFTKPKMDEIVCGAPVRPGCQPPDVPEFDLGASPILVKLRNGKRVLILGQKTGMVYAVDPDRDGKLLWFQRAGEGGLLGGVQWGMATNGQRVFVAVSDLAFQGRGLDPTKGGGISAYQLSDGKLLWHTPPPGCGDRRPCSPAQSQAVSAIPGAVFSGSIDGHLRAYAGSDGKIIWDFDTA
ncbi:MAG: PQQ-binding-like beta-propeller repeat protein, partial [Acidobacteriota bacterium]|nr:PQQ-binding-like beta-propeller repeat protein [Acidobacteriota bacterium]